MKLLSAMRAFGSPERGLPCPFGGGRPLSQAARVFFTALTFSLWASLTAHAQTLPPLPPPAPPPAVAPQMPDAAATKTAGADTIVVPTAPTVFVLPGGARVVALYEPRSPLVTIDCFFRVGTPEETGNESGSAALIARAWFGDTDSRTARLQQFEIDRQGGGLGAIAWGELTELWSVGGADAAEVETAARTLLLNIVAAPRFERATVEEARAELLRDTTLDDDNAGEAVLAALKRRVWPDSPLGDPPGGTPENVARRTPAQLQRFYARYFRPNRAVFVVAGNITPDAARDLVRSNLNAGGWLLGASGLAAPQKTAPPPVPLAPTEIRPGLRPVSLGRGGRAGVVAVGFAAPGTENNAKAYGALLLLDAVLGGGKSARLFRDLRDSNSATGATSQTIGDAPVLVAPSTTGAPESAAPLPGGTAPPVTVLPESEAATATPPVGYDIRTTIQAGTGQSLWAVYVTGAQNAATVEAAIKHELAPLADGSRPITDAELTRARAFLFRERLQKRQRLKDRAFRTGWAVSMGLGATWDADFEQTISALTADDVNQLARTLLGAPSATVDSR